MRALLFFPFTFVAGLDGFGLFVPYLLAVLTALYLTRIAVKSRRSAATRAFMPFMAIKRPVLVPIPVRARQTLPL